MLMSHDDFVAEFNFHCQGGEPQPPEVIAELESLIRDMMQATCGSIADFEIINNKGQIRLIGAPHEEN